MNKVNRCFRSESKLQFASAAHSFRKTRSSVDSERKQSTFKLLTRLLRADCCIYNPPDRINADLFVGIRRAFVEKVQTRPRTFRKFFFL